MGDRCLESKVRLVEIGSGRSEDWWFCYPSWFDGDGDEVIFVWMDVCMYVLMRKAFLSRSDVPV